MVRQKRCHSAASMGRISMSMPRFYALVPTGAAAFRLCC
jgi:hypothetical protein